MVSPFSPLGPGDHRPASATRQGTGKDLNDTLAAFVRDFPPAFRSHREEKRETVYRYSVAFILYVLNQPQIRWQPPVPDRIAAVVRAINISLKKTCLFLYCALAGAPRGGRLPASCFIPGSAQDGGMP